MVITIWLWSLEHYLYDDVYYSKSEAIAAINTATRTALREEDFIESHDTMPHRWIPRTNQHFKIRLFERTVNVSKATKLPDV